MTTHAYKILRSQPAAMNCRAEADLVVCVCVCFFFFFFFFSGCAVGTEHKGYNPSIL